MSDDNKDHVTALSSDNTKDHDVPRGKPKSGRIWKSQHARSNSKVNVKPLHSSWKIKMKNKVEKRSIREFQKELKLAECKTKEEKRRYIEARRKKKEENAKKAEMVQVISKSSRIKKMKKKHLKSIEIR